jgi:aminoglycoside phosphotransferase family enzyme/predicted kinase
VVEGEELGREVDTDPRLIAYLMNQDNYPERGPDIAHFETHISHVFVGGDLAYKIKKPVDLGFLDFSALWNRRFFCREEVRLNSRLAPGIYLGVIPIFGSNGAYSFEKRRGWPVVEWAVKMKRLPEDRILSNLILEGRLLAEEMRGIGERLARFHNEVPVYRGRVFGGLESVTFNTEENFQEIRPFCGSMLEKGVYDKIEGYTRGFLKKNEALFSARRRSGFVREGHGDLHSQHICLTRPPVIVDCIEFNKRFRISDILEDMAFLHMDLEYRGRFDLSARLESAYFSLQEPALSHELLRFYKIYRAVVRAKVQGFTAQGLSDEAGKRDAVRRAREYYALAEHYIDQKDRAFNPVIFMGVSGSGKSALALNLLAGAVLLRSDEVRKDLVGIGGEEHTYVDYGQGIYDSTTTRRTYERLHALAVDEARSGKRVLVDATYTKAEQRQEIFRASSEAGLNPLFIHCFADEAVLRRRVEERMGRGADVSDARPAIVTEQLKKMEAPTELPFFRVLCLNTDDNLDSMRKALREFL